MGESEPSPGPGTGRVQALSDGIFAVAMTLLVFDFHVPALPHTASNVLVTPALLRLWPEFITYVVSFLSLGVYWIGHHNMYHVVRRADRTLLGLNIVFFLFVALLPFSTSVLNAFMQTQTGLLFFGANLTIIGWLLFLQWAYVSSQPGMLAPFVTPAHRDVVRVRFLVYPVVVTLTMLLCFWSVPISLAVYLLLLPTYMIPGTPDAPASAPADARSRTHAKRRKAAIVGLPAQATPAPEEPADAQPPGRRRMDRKVLLRLLVPVAAALILLGWVLFRPELLFVNTKVEEAFPGSSHSVVLLSGRFHGVAHETQGMASVYQLPGAGRLLRLTNFKTSNGPDVRVFLIAASDAMDNATVTRNGFYEVGRLKANEGDQNYALPASLNLSGFHAVTIWCNRFHVNFATAPLAAH